MDEDMMVLDTETVMNSMIHRRGDLAHLIPLGNPNNQSICKHYLKGQCKKGDDCHYLHIFDLAKMAECQFMKTFHFCNNEDCVFRHTTMGGDTQDCEYFNRGFCKHGQPCNNRHTSKEHPCPNYLAGFCPDGPDCRFGHPKFELPDDQGGSTDEPRARQGKRTPIICHKCGQVGHKAAHCSNPALELPPLFRLPNGPRGGGR